GRPRRPSRCAGKKASPDGVDEWKAAQVEVAHHVATDCETWCDLAGRVQVRKEDSIGVSLQGSTERGGWIPGLCWQPMERRMKHSGKECRVTAFE
ncbi:unnamed protein product, partial [Ectocarpus sp. 8 AP-2014]